MGGAVRDELLGLPVLERDWVVVGSTPDEMIQQGFKLVGGHFPVFLHPETHEEYALARTEIKQGVGYKGFLIHADPTITLEEDLLRRDLTINAIAKTDQGQLLDPYHGVSDIKSRQLRHVSHAFLEDPLRVLRVARFAAKLFHLNFIIVPETLSFLKQITASGELTALSVERLGHETQKALLTPEPDIYFLTLFQCGALAILLPELVGNYTANNVCPMRLALKQACHQNLDLSIRIGCALIPWCALPESEIDLLNQIDRMSHQLCLPKKQQNLLKGIARVLQCLKSSDQLSAQRYLDLLLKIDVARKVEQFQQILTVVNLILEADEASSSVLLIPLKKAWNAIQLINAGMIASQSGLQGQPLAQAIRDAKLQAIEKVLD